MGSTTRQYGLVWFGWYQRWKKCGNLATQLPESFEESGSGRKFLDPFPALSHQQTVRWKQKRNFQKMGHIFDQFFLYYTKLAMKLKSFVISRHFHVYEICSFVDIKQSKNPFAYKKQLFFAERFRPNPQVARNTFDFFHLWTPNS